MQNIKDYIPDFINNNSPQFTNYNGHGINPPCGWGCFFGTHSASTLTNEIPTIAFAGSCDTAKFVNTSHNYYTITEALGEASNFTGEICDQSDDKDWFGELFVKNPNGGAVVYIGSTVVVQDWCQDLNKYF